MTNKKYDIYERIFKFIVAVIRFTRKISKTLENRIIIKQLLRSVTSMGANSQEADGVETKRDFIHCFTIVKKEAKETLFWIRLLGEINNIETPELEALLQESNEIIAIVSTIIIRTKKK